ncbi:MAG: hypothetical protein PHT14_01640 [Petrimonas sp.]|jgi:uncharacterized membrane protein|uniref:Uncharacterized protein n=1 Tax=bioreactor metagenome TaxID=1076179 RepID=A0A644X8T7_9ZZZZ|nr:hypothetical protein [Petrimonas sp.]BBD46800.1 Hypothetical protein PEIBARAKI_6793 [Petrimonas sp. IBARAKI]HBG80299.1 hypothetical protein [Porphyromonadaceae bacterium]MDD2911852.1 hypothetical protein [Petrimonas sp.]MDD3542384.1 hypothetical protein [Petrimonas sp.]
MATKKQIFTAMWAIIVVIAIASIVCLIVLPKWKGIFLASGGGFLIVNIFISMFFIQNNYRDKK